MIAVRVTVVERSAQGWLTREHGEGEMVSLVEPAITFQVDELYGTTTLDP